MSLQPTVLVLGATGRFGQAACHAFADAGWQVLAQRRPRPAGVPSTDGQIRWIDTDPQDAAAMTRLAPSADVVVHAMNPAYTDVAWRREAAPLLEAAITQARRLDALLLFPGNVYNYGAALPAVLREDTPQRPTTEKGRIRVALEQRLAQAAADHGLRSVVLRAGDFFGAGRGSLLDLLLAKDLQRGIVGLPGALDVPTPFAYLPDLARTAVAIAQCRHGLDGARALHFAGHVLTGAQWRDALGAAAQDAGWLAPDAAPRVKSTPWPLIRALGVVVPTFASLAEIRYVWNTPHGLDNQALRALIGHEPHTPLPQAVRAALADLGMAPSLRPQAA